MASPKPTAQQSQSARPSFTRATHKTRPNDPELAPKLGPKRDDLGGANAVAIDRVLGNNPHPGNDHSYVLGHMKDDPSIRFQARVNGASEQVQSKRPVVDQLVISKNGHLAHGENAAAPEDNRTSKAPEIIHARDAIIDKLELMHGKERSAEQRQQQEVKEQEAKEKEPSAKIIFARPQQSKITFPRPDKDKAQDKDQAHSARITFRKRDDEMRTPASDAASKDNTKPSHKPIYGQLAVFAEYERALISERTKAGMAAAKARGVHCGRPRRAA